MGRYIQMMRNGRCRGLLGWTCVALLGMVPVFAGCPATPSLGVLPAAFNFGTARIADTFTVYNAGGGTLAWQAAAVPPWVTLSTGSGSLTQGVQTVQITIDRNILPPGQNSATFQIRSNGGDVDVSVAAQVEEGVGPAELDVSPVSVDFGTATNSATLTLRNTGADELTWSVSESLAWLSATPTSGRTQAGATSTVTLAASRAGLPVGATTGTVNITSNGGDVPVPVSITVSGPTPSLQITPGVLNFGTNSTVSTAIVSNGGQGTLEWTATSDQPWLTVAPETGSTTTNPATLTVQVDRTGLAEGDYTGTISLDSNGGTGAISVTMRVVPALSLVVNPLSLDFGAFQTNKLFTVANQGTGSLDWTIDTSGFPAWLSVVPESGTAGGDPQGVLVTVDRTGLAPGNYSAQIPVNSNGGSFTVAVSMRVNTQPVLSVVSLGELNQPDVNTNGDPIVRLGTQLDVDTFTVRNSGTGTLDWSIIPLDASGRPTARLADWVEITPLAGSTLANAPAQTVTVRVNRANQPEGALRQLIRIESNGGNVLVEITAQVPRFPIIGAGPEELIFDGDARSDVFGVANLGSRDTLLRFVVSSNRSWLYVFPTTGISIGTDSPIKDVQTIGVSIDRGGLGANGDTGEITIVAVDEAGAIIPEVEPATVLISVEPVELLFEAADAWLRVPSLVRYIFLMRDFRDLAIDIEPEALTNAFRVFEDREPLEISETGLYVTDNYRANIAVLLDYSGSMFAAAGSLGSLNPVDPLQELYETVLIQDAQNFLTELGPQKRVGLYEFHDQSSALNEIQRFTTRTDLVQQALDGVVVADHGATVLFPALTQAAGELESEELFFLPFDTTDVRAVLLVSDGRRTTPPGLISDLIDLLAAAKVRVFAVGWGRDVNNEVLARIAAETGGHYYPTLPDPVTSLPQISELRRRLLQAAGDLNSMLVLTYQSLRTEEQVPVRVDASFDHPDPDITTVSGSLPERDLGLGGVADDVQLGQIAMRTDGILAGTARVVIRAEYVPRNINKFAFNLNAPRAFTVQRIPADEGGLLDDGWTLAGPPGGGPGTYILTSPTVLPVSAFGDLLYVDFPAPGNNQFRLELTVDNGIYSSDIQPKYFAAPDTILIRPDASSLAPGLPTPTVSTLSLAFGQTLTTQTLDIANVGARYHAGSYNVQLEWEVDDLPTFLSVAPSQGVRASTVGSDRLTFTFNRTLDPGFYSGVVRIRWTGGDAGVGGFIFVSATGQIVAP